MYDWMYIWVGNMKVVNSSVWETCWLLPREHVGNRGVITAITPTGTAEQCDTLCPGTDRTGVWKENNQTWLADLQVN